MTLSGWYKRAREVWKRGLQRYPKMRRVAILLCLYVAVILCWVFFLKPLIFAPYAYATLAPSHWHITKKPVASEGDTAVSQDLPGTILTCSYTNCSRTRNGGNSWETLRMYQFANEKNP